MAEDETWLKIRDDRTANDPESPDSYFILLRNYSRRIFRLSSFKALPLILILLGNLTIWSGVISAEGFIMTGDFSFPIRNENFEKHYFPLWNDLRSQTNIERIPRLLIVAPYLLLSELGIDVSNILKTFLVSTYVILTLSMYLFLESIQQHLFSKRYHKSWVFSLLAGFIFAYNPASLQFAGGISILFSVGILPLILSLILSRYNDRYLPFYVSCLLLLSIGHPFTAASYL